jgi:hypothetical protein
MSQSNYYFSRLGENFANLHTAFILIKALQALQAAAPKTVQAERSHFHHRHHNSPLDSYVNRVCLAHVAMMTFGLVALLGVWHDPVQGLCFAASVCALMIFGALLILDSRIAAGLFSPSYLLIVARAREALIPERSLRRMMRWYCYANHLGVPPPQSLDFNVSTLEAILNDAPIRSVLPLFVFRFVS